MEITSWAILDAIKKAADVVESVGNLQTEHNLSVFCVIEEDHLELVYSDSAVNFLRRYEDKDEFKEALEERKEDGGEAPHDQDDVEFNEDEDEEDEDEFDVEDESDSA
ncbi:MAG: hypothetical protein A2Y56_15230 [Candidatus Aminicenantes bacterium RBG_13_63_10]|nr:MAG: hypothetical protein A2Y56_15230 [Candidatus Aminicenantes bacterium RBG_13_63_10]